ncbi:hypothetical protein MASR1M74_02130 [Lentimicrobium sp.]
MREEYDIMLNEAYDIAIESGDFVIGENLNQQVACLLEANAGDFRQGPNTGVGLHSFLLDEGTDELNRKIRLELKKDGLQVERLEFKNTGLTIDAKRAN